MRAPAATPRPRQRASREAFTAYANQPAIAQWNLARLAETLLPLLDDDPNKAKDLAEEAIHSFGAVYKEKSNRFCHHVLSHQVEVIV